MESITPLSALQLHEPSGIFLPRRNGCRALRAWSATRHAVPWRERVRPSPLREHAPRVSRRRACELGKRCRPPLVPTAPRESPCFCRKRKLPAPLSAPCLTFLYFRHFTKETPWLISGIGTNQIVV